MPQVAIRGSEVRGTTTGEHHGHSYPSPTHPPCALNGTVTQGSPKMLALGIGVALEAYSVSETDCCGPGTGRLARHAHKIRVQGQWVQLVTDSTVPHNGSANIITGTPKVHCVI